MNLNNQGTRQEFVVNIQDDTTPGDHVTVFARRADAEACAKAEAIMSTLKLVEG